MLQTQSHNQTQDYIHYPLLDEGGFLVDAYEWTREYTQQLARENALILSQKHWDLIELIRDKYLRLGALPPMRLVCKSVGVKREDIKQQFGSCLKLWKLAGLPNPGEEAITYMN